MARTKNTASARRAAVSTVVAAVVFGHIFSTPVRAAAPTPEAVNTAIQRGIGFLYSAQNPEGTWEIDAPPPPGPVAKPADKHGTADYSQHGGRTAVAVYALLEAGESPAEPKLQKAIDYLRKTPSVFTYPLSLRCQVWANLPPTPENRAALRRDAGALLAMKKISPAKTGNLVWDYAAVATPRFNFSLNNTQQGAWGLSVASDMDYEVPPDVWKQIDKTFDAAQLPDGSFGAIIPTAKTPTPATSLYGTATGVSALYLAQDYSRADAYAIPKGNATNPQIDKGIEWIAKRLDGTEEPNDNASVNRRWYGVGIVALASGRRRLGEADWYAVGATAILGRQSKGSYWGSRSEKADFRVIDTSWAILFLQRGRVPVAFNKLNYAAASADPAKALWNQRPRDAANLTRWISRASERDLRWQILDAGDSLDAYLEAPVLYLPGGEALALNQETKDKLKAYAEHGGLIFAAADAGSVPFAKSVEKLGLELFPGNEWRDLPDTHPIFTTQAYKKSAFKGKVQLRGLGNGVRELIVLVPTGDPAKTWQLKSGRTNPDAWQLPADVLSYAVDKSHFFPRGTSWLVPPTPLVAKQTITIGRLKYAGKWDAEPAAWEEFGHYAQARDTAVKTVTIDAGTEIKGVDAIYVTGTTAFTLDDAARRAIKTYLDAGGRILFEAAGGSGDFAASAQAELTRWYGADALAQLPADHKLYGDKLAVAYRTFSAKAGDMPTGPQLAAVEKDGRVIAILSRHDLSAGLLGVQTDGIVGYTPETARGLLLRVLTRWK